MQKTIIKFKMGKCKYSKACELYKGDSSTCNVTNGRYGEKEATCSKNKKIMVSFIYLFIFIFCSVLVPATTVISDAGIIGNLLGQNQFTMINYSSITDVPNINNVYYVQPGNFSDIQFNIDTYGALGKIVVPCGNYYGATPIDISKNINLEGAAPACVILYINGTAFENTADLERSHVVINNFRVEGDGTGIGLNMSNMYYSDFSNLRFTDHTISVFSPIGNNFYNSLKNIRSLEAGTGFQLDSNQNSIIGGRVHTATDAHINITGSGNTIQDVSMELIANIGADISGDGNNLISVWAENTPTAGTGFILRSTAGDNSITGYVAGLSINVLDQTSETGLGNTWDIRGADNNQFGLGKIRYKDGVIETSDNTIDFLMNRTTGDGTFSFDLYSDATANAKFRLFRNTNTVGTRSLVIYKGDGTATTTFEVNANTGEIETGVMGWTKLNSYPAACPTGSYVTQVDDTITCTSPTTTVNEQTVSGEDLLLYLPLDGNLEDYSKNGKDIVTSIDVNPTTIGKFGSAYSFDSATNTLDTPSDLINSSESYSICAWVNPRVLSSDARTIVGDRASGNAFVFKVDNFAPTALVFEYWNTTGSSATIKGSTALSLNTYSLACSTFDSTTNNISIYLNGFLEDSAIVVGEAADGAGIQRIGYPQNGASRYWDGTMDDIKFYNYTLTPSQILNIHNQPTEVLDKDSMMYVSKDNNPITDAVYSLGSSALRWLKGWFVNVDVSGDIVVGSLSGTGNDFACLDSTGKLFRSATACA